MAAYAVMRCPTVRLSVRLSVTFVHPVKMNKDIFEIAILSLCLASLHPYC